ncbi:hypothetical protein [Basilea psittacipulmonis]|uniref:Uncharacterized protein n=1 Tax=Basilea psittacipulmonis DSM 24701 TaxID=1072685 RepID=A0A077DBC5_9BURK|nr:hypothetical protein [Basilea psittacipulmonis]AIL31964.1 hypothetical protein IX83_00260 [Basilea psittacipulmonis DSM 24701]
MKPITLNVQQDVLMIKAESLNLRLDLKPLYYHLKQPSASFFEIETLIYEIEEFLETHMTELKHVHANTLLNQSAEGLNLFKTVMDVDNLKQLTREQVEQAFNNVAMSIEHPHDQFVPLLRHHLSVVLLVFIREIMHHLGLDQLVFD